jgi:hypothetical protein
MGSLVLILTIDVVAFLLLAAIVAAADVSL